jgi:hypothetical protein
MPQREPHINLDPQWLSLMGKKYIFTDLCAPHPSLSQLGVMMITAIIYEHDDLPQLGLWTPDDVDMCHYYPIQRLKIEKEPGSTTPVPSRLLHRAGIYPDEQQLVIDAAG